MALSDTARLVAALELQDKFSSTASKFDRTVAGMDSRTQKLGQLGQHIGQGIRTTATNLAKLGVVAGGVIAANVAAGVRSLSELENVQTQTEAVLKSTRGAAGLTAVEIRNLAQEYENLNATVDDKVIQSGENLLLTFTSIRKNAFEPALQAALDMNQAMGGGEEGLQQTIIRVGKALQDPIKGATALRRVGVNLTQQQQDQIKKLVESNRLYDAQKLILRELSTEFGGSFAKAGDTAAGKFAKVRDAIEDAQQALATAFLPVLTKVADKLSTFLADPKVIQQIKDFGSGLASGFERVVEFVSKIDFGTIGTSLRIAGAGAKAVFDAFIGLPPWIQTAVLTGWGLNKLSGGALGNIFGDAIKLAFPKLDIFSRGATPANPMFTKEVGIPGTGTPGVPGGGGFGSGFLKGAAVVFGAAAAAELGNILGHSLFFDPTVKPAVTFEQSQFDKLVKSAEGDPARLQHAIDVIQKGLDDMPLPAQLLARDQIAELERQRDLLKGMRDSAVKQGQAAQENNQQNERLLAEAKAGRLATVHQGQLTQAQLEKLTLEQRLQADKNFHKSIDSVTEFINLLKRTSEFGVKGVGTTIEQGAKTGRDPVGDAFVALVDRLDKKTLKNNQVQGEISRHVKALEQVQGRLLKEGNTAAAKHAQRNIDTLLKLIGEVDKTIPHFRRIADKQQETRLAQERGTQKTSGLLGDLLGTNRNTASNTAAIARKNFSPRVNVTVPVTTTVSINDVIRSITHARTAFGTGIGGAVDPTLG